jgi:hypothetical protein
MTRYISLLFAVLVLTACGKEKDEKPLADETPAALAFTTKSYSKKSTLPCKRDTCTYVGIKVPEASGIPIVGDSINKKVFNTVRGIVYFGEKPYNASNYEQLMASFIKSYEDLLKKFPEDAIPWEAHIHATVHYHTDSLINIQVNNYTYTGGAHGYEGNLSLLFNAATGKSLTYADIFKDKKAITAYAEKKFRAKFRIPPGANINSEGFMFENDTFALPQNIFFNKDGLLLVYNPYEAASYAEGPLELLLPYGDIEKYLAVK